MAELQALAEKAFVVITTVGPYCMYGGKVFKACADSGTHYLDCTGETPWVARMIRRYEETARSTGAIMLPQTGVESAPPDLCTWALARFLRAKLDAPTSDVVISLHNLSSAPSGGTLATVLSIFDYFSLDELRASSKPYASSPIPHPEKARPTPTLLQRWLGVCNVPNLGVLTTSIAGRTDVPVVERSWGLLSQIPSRKDQFYGPRFNWVEYYKPRNWLHGILVHLGLVFGTAMLALFPPVRTLVKRFVYQPGEGRTKEEMAKEEIEYRGVATPDTPTAAGKQAYCRAWFHGSMYYRKLPKLPNHTLSPWKGTDCVGSNGRVPGARSADTVGGRRRARRWSIHAGLPWARLRRPRQHGGLQDRCQDDSKLSLDSAGNNLRNASGICHGLVALGDVPDSLANVVNGAPDSFPVFEPQKIVPIGDDIPI